MSGFFCEHCGGGLELHCPCEMSARIAELEAERDEARAFVREILDSDEYSSRHVLLKCHSAAAKWEAECSSSDSEVGQ